MYLSRILLDTTKRETLLALSSPAMFHGAVESAFSGERKRNLWRVDQLNGQYYLLILSHDVPRPDAALEQFSKSGTACETKDYEPLLQRVKNGTSWNFMLRANPTYSVSAEKGARGRVCAHSTTEHQRQWLLRQSLQHGFTLEEEQFDVVMSRWYHFSKGIKGKQVSLLAATYTGRLTVTDADAFRDMLTQGLGREKAYGVGLMTLVRANG